MTKAVVHPDAKQDESVLSAIEFDFNVKDGQLFLNVGHNGTTAGINVILNVNSDALLDKLETAIPGDWDKGIIAILKAAIANVKV